VSQAKLNWHRKVKWEGRVVHFKGKKPRHSAENVCDKWEWAWLDPFWLLKADLARQFRKIL